MRVSGSEEIQTAQGWWWLNSRDGSDNETGLDVAGEWQAGILRHRVRNVSKISHKN